MCKSYGKNKSWETWLYKTIQSGGFPGKYLGSLMKVVLPLMKSILTPSANSWFRNNNNNFK